MMKFFVGQIKGIYFFTYRQMKGMGASKCQYENIKPLLTCSSSTYTFNTTCVYVLNLYDWRCWTSLLLLFLQRNSPKRDNRHENSHSPVRFWLCTKQLVLKKIIKAYVQFHELIETWYAKFQLQLNYFHCYQSTMYAMFAYTTVQTLTLEHILTFYTHSLLCTRNIFVWFNVLSFMTFSKTVVSCKKPC